jgi:hypothetical protein
MTLHYGGVFDDERLNEYGIDKKNAVEGVRLVNNFELLHKVPVLGHLLHSIPGSAVGVDLVCDTIGDHLTSAETRKTLAEELGKHGYRGVTADNVDEEFQHKRLPRWAREEMLKLYEREASNLPHNATVAGAATAGGMIFGPMGMIPGLAASMGSGYAASNLMHHEDQPTVLDYVNTLNKAQGELLKKKHHAEDIRNVDVARAVLGTTGLATGKDLARMTDRQVISKVRNEKIELQTRLGWISPELMQMELPKGAEPLSDTPVGVIAHLMREGRFHADTLLKRQETWVPKMTTALRHPALQQEYLASAKDRVPEEKGDRVVAQACDSCGPGTHELHEDPRVEKVARDLAQRGVKAHNHEEEEGHGIPLAQRAKQRLAHLMHGGEHGHRAA